MWLKWLNIQKKRNWTYFNMYFLKKVPQKVPQKVLLKKVPQKVLLKKVPQKVLLKKVPQNYTLNQYNFTSILTSNFLLYFS